MEASPDEIIYTEQSRHFLQQVIDSYENISPYIEDMAKQRGNELLGAHTRVRQAARLRGIRYRVEPQMPPDLLGIYIYLPTLNSRA